MSVENIKKNYKLYNSQFLKGHHVELYRIFSFCDALDALWWVIMVL